MLSVLNFASLVTHAMFLRSRRRKRKCSRSTSSPGTHPSTHPSRKEASLGLAVEAVAAAVVAEDGVVDADVVAVEEGEVVDHMTVAAVVVVVTRHGIAHGKTRTRRDEQITIGRGDTTRRWPVEEVRAKRLPCVVVRINVYTNNLALCIQTWEGYFEDLA